MDTAGENHQNPRAGTCAGYSDRGCQRVLLQCCRGVPPKRRERADCQRCELLGEVTVDENNGASAPLMLAEGAIGEELGEFGLLGGKVTVAPVSLLQKANV